MSRFERTKTDLDLTDVELLMLTREERDVLKKRVEELERDIDWMRQTIHRAHHEGPLDECKKNTCDAALRLLGKR